MKKLFVLSIAVISILLFSSRCVAQVQVIDGDAYNGAFNVGAYLGFGEYIFRVDEDGADATIHVLDVDSGVIRPLATPGIDADVLFPNPFGGRILIYDGSTSNPTDVLSASYSGSSAPFSLHPEPGERVFTLQSEVGGHLLMLVPGDPFSADPGERDRLYTRSLTGGPATEILDGDLPFGREVHTGVFSHTATSLLVITEDGFVNRSIPEKLYLATPGAPGLTPVLPTSASNVEYRVLGSDVAGEHFVIVEGYEGSFGDGLLWSIPIDDPTSPTRLDMRASDGFDIAYVLEQLDPLGSRILYTSEEPEFNGGGQPRIVSLMEAPLDGSSPPRVIGNLPPGAEASGVFPSSISQWDYVSGSFSNVGTVSSFDGFYAINNLRGDVVHIAVEDEVRSRTFEFTTSGHHVVFADARTAGNDLYIGSPENGGTVRRLWDNGLDGQIVGMTLSPDEQFALVGLTDADSFFTATANRLVAVPLSGGPAVTLVDVSENELPTSIYMTIGLDPIITGSKVMYAQFDTSGQFGFYTVDIPTFNRPGDFNGDGTVDGNDLARWQASYAVNSDADADGDGDSDGRDYLSWQQSRSAAAAGTQAVPEPMSVLLLVPALALPMLLRSN